jgi:hypothetical protein
MLRRAIGNDRMGKQGHGEKSGKEKHCSAKIDEVWPRSR